MSSFSDARSPFPSEGKKGPWDLFHFRCLFFIVDKGLVFPSWKRVPGTFFLSSWKMKVPGTGVILSHPPLPPIHLTIRTTALDALPNLLDILLASSPASNYDPAMRILPFALALSIALFSRAKEPTTQPSVFAQASGEWIIDSSTGQKQAGHIFVDKVGTSISISNNRMSWIERSGTDAQGKSLWVRVSRKLVPRHDISPSAVDIIADDPDYKAWSRVGIMEVLGDELRLAVNFPQGPRPTKFQKGDDGQEYTILLKVKPAGRLSPQN